MLWPRCVPGWRKRTSRCTPTKTKIVDTEKGGVEFLGYRFERGRRFPRKKSLTKLRGRHSGTRRGVRRAAAWLRPIADVNRTLRGWCEYFKHCHRTTFKAQDGWIRLRLRSILRRRLGKRGRGRGLDHQRWPNAYFQAHGYLSLVAAHASAWRSSSR